MVIDYLNSLADASSDICVAFVYCRYTEPMTVREILAAVVRQLVERYPQLTPMVEPMCAKHQLQKTKPTEKELICLIRDICAAFRVAYIFIDGLDEALPDERFDFLDALKSIKANFMITSRPLHILEDVLPNAAFFDIIAREEDVELLVAQRIERSPGLRRLLCDEEKRRQVIAKVCEASQGM
jgi:ankyrin repeat domain-containing protein 50